jgi:hypothetical protein
LLFVQSAVNFVGGAITGFQPTLRSLNKYLQGLANFQCGAFPRTNRRLLGLQFPAGTPLRMSFLPIAGYTSGWICERWPTLRYESGVGERIGDLA